MFMNDRERDKAIRDFAAGKTTFAALQEKGMDSVSLFCCGSANSSCGRRLHLQMGRTPTCVQEDAR